jgi:hypothetical protein
MTPDERYKVFNSQVVAEQFRSLAAEARASGRLPLFLAAAKWIMEELARTPTEFGESWTVRPGSDLIFRRGCVGPLFVQYALREKDRVVYIRRFALMG